MAPLSLTTFRPLSRSIQSTRSRPLAQIQTNRFSTTRTQRQGQNLSDVSVTDRMSLKGRNIFITGGGRGIGFAITKAVAQLGGNIAVVDALPEPVEEFHSLGSKYGAKTFYQKADVTNQSSIESAFKNAVSEVGEFEGCVPAAGIALDKPVFEHGWDESVRVLMVNTMGTFWTAKLVADHMKQHGKGGSIVMIASVAAQGIKVPEQNLAIYNMSKAAVKGLVGPLAVELSEYNIRVNSISPGAIESPMTAAIQTEYPQLFQMFNNAAPVGRFGKPTDLTPMFTYLLGDAAAFTTGVDFPITGGLHAGIRPSWMHRAMPQ